MKDEKCIFFSATCNGFSRDLAKAIFPEIKINKYDSVLKFSTGKDTMNINLTVVDNLERMNQTLWEKTLENWDKFAIIIFTKNPDDLHDFI